MTRASSAIAARHGLALVEDCCQAHLATADGRPVGTIGVAGAFSFYPTKNLGALGDGGAVVTNDARWPTRMRRLRNGGQTERYHHAGAGRELAARRDAGGDPARAPAVPRGVDRTSAARWPPGIARSSPARRRRRRARAAIRATSIICSSCAAGGRGPTAGAPGRRAASRRWFTTRCRFRAAGARVDRPGRVPDRRRGCATKSCRCRFTSGD